MGSEDNYYSGLQLVDRQASKSGLKWCRVRLGGSHLWSTTGPGVLFIIYINDIDTVADLIDTADNTKLGQRVPTGKD